VRNPSAVAFFVPKRGFTEQEAAFFVNVDFVDHVALVAVVEECDRPVIAGGGRYIVVRPGVAEIAFAVVDQYQGCGVVTALMRHLAAILKPPALRGWSPKSYKRTCAWCGYLKRSGFRISTMREADYLYVILRLH
jgi:GNAT superfamily N-acetyltransferase